jgi:hypothetical protein
MTSSTTQPLFGPKRFTGTLTSGTDAVPIAFETTIGPDGALRPIFEHVPLSNQSVFIKLRWSQGDRAGKFAVDASSNDGYRLISERLELYETGTGSGPNHSFITFKGDFAEATITWQLKEPAKKPFLHFLVRGATGYGQLKAKSSLGPLSFTASNNSVNHNDMPGDLCLRGPASGDLDAWRQKGDDFLRRLLRLMSFASGFYLHVPLTQFFAGTKGQLVARRLPEGARAPFLSPVHFMTRNPFFQRAVRVSDSDTELVKRLEVTIEWHAMAPDYNELRLFAKMTAIENLLWSNFPKLRQRRGRKQKSLADKVAELIKTWNVSMNDLPATAVDDLVKARNKIVHQGEYYAPKKPNQPELWDHIIVAHELLNRAILTAIGYKGQYTCYLGRMHTREFPACTKR